MSLEAFKEKSDIIKTILRRLDLALVREDFKEKKIWRQEDFFFLIVQI